MTTPIQVGDRVRYVVSPATTATVKAVGTNYLAVQVDGRPYEDAWPIHSIEPIGDDDR